MDVESSDTIVGVKQIIQDREGESPGIMSAGVPGGLAFGPRACQDQFRGQVSQSAYS